MFLNIDFMLNVKIDSHGNLAVPPKILSYAMSGKRVGLGELQYTYNLQSISFTLHAHREIQYWRLTDIIHVIL